LTAKTRFDVCVRYKKESGDNAIALLLGSGYWGMARHPNYTAEFCTFLAWTLPWTRPAAFLPLCLLAAILWIRMRRDELRCQSLYGQCWSQHCAKVPYLLFTGF